MENIKSILTDGSKTSEKVGTGATKGWRSNETEIDECLSACDWV